MDLRHLTYFLAVAEELNFTRASQRLHVVQSAVSAAVRTLEKDLGAALFERSSQGVTLTAAGRALLPHAQATLDAAQAARDAVGQIRGELQGTINLGALTSMRVIDLPGLLGRFHAEHPKVTLRLVVSPSGSAGLVQSLLAGHIDLAFVALTGPVPAGITSRTLATFPMVLIVPTGHPLAASDTVSLPELADKQFVDFPVGYRNRDLVDTAFSAAGLRRWVALEATDIGSTAALVREGLGIAFIPEFAVTPDTDGIRVLRIRNTDLTWTLSLAVSATRRTSAPLQALLEMTDSYLPLESA
ncbi:LysR family transcriptional regulator [Streptomyces sp. NPDC000880]